MLKLNSVARVGLVFIAPEGDPFAQFQPKKVNWSILFKGSVAVTPPVIRP